MGERKEGSNNKDSFAKDNLPSIQFKRKKMKSNTKLVIKSLIFFFIPIIISTVFSSLFLNIKYKEMVENMKEKIEKDDVVLEYSSLVDKVRNSLVTIASSKENLNQGKYIDGNTTGVIIESDGKILTNYSTIKDVKDIYVKLPFVGSEPIKADIIVANEDVDIAIIQVYYDEKLTPIKFASNDEVVEGERIALISNSIGSDYIDNIIPGVITSTNRKLSVHDKDYDLLEVNTPINIMNTGGVISNIKGELIGFASKKVTDDMNISNLYYALDLSSLEKIINYTNEIKNILGILEGGFIDNKKSGDNLMGLYVARINNTSELNESGLRPTDIIFEIDGEKINSISEVLKMLKNKKNGDNITCKVMRAGNVKEINIKLENINQ